METRTFELRAVLTVTTERLLTKRLGPHDNGISALYDILNWMTSDNLFTHQLPRAGRECKPWLLRWFPGLEKASDALPSLDKLIETCGGEDGCTKWIEALIAGGQPATFDVPKIPRDDHERKNPFDELVEMRGTDEGIILVQP